MIYISLSYSGWEKRDGVLLFPSFFLPIRNNRLHAEQDHPSNDLDPIELLRWGVDGSPPLRSSLSLANAGVGGLLALQVGELCGDVQGVVIQKLPHLVSGPILLVEILHPQLLGLLVKPVLGLHWLPIVEVLDVVQFVFRIAHLVQRALHQRSSQSLHADYALITFLVLDDLGEVVACHAASNEPRSSIEHKELPRTTRFASQVRETKGSGGYPA